MRVKKIELLDADITELEVDAIVNAANSSLLGGGGVDGSIHRAAGPQLLAECRDLNGCPSGQAKITGGHRLLAGYVIHTVGPVWRGGDQDEAELLASCYKQCFQLAAENKIKSIALPAISTGVYGFPKDKAAAIAIHETLAALALYPGIRRVIMVCFGPETRAAYANALQEER